MKMAKSCRWIISVLLCAFLCQYITAVHLSTETRQSNSAPSADKLSSGGPSARTPSALTALNGNGAPRHTELIHTTKTGTQVVLLLSDRDDENRKTTQTHSVGDTAHVHSTADHIKYQRTHIDLPEEHGNNSTKPFIHRIDTHSHGHSDHDKYDRTHVDLPGEHFNDSPHPIVHRVDSSGTHNHEHNHVKHSKIHVDLPGENNNNSPHPIIHRVDSSGTHKHEHNHDTHDHNHVKYSNLLRRHNNTSTHPVINRVDNSVHDQNTHPVEAHETVRQRNDLGISFRRSELYPLRNHMAVNGQIENHRLLPSSASGNNVPVDVQRTASGNGIHINIPGIRGTSNTRVPEIYRERPLLSTDTQLPHRHASPTHSAGVPVVYLRETGLARPLQSRVPLPTRHFTGPGSVPVGPVILPGPGPSTRPLYPGHMMIAGPPPGPGGEYMAPFMPLRPIGPLASFPPFIRRRIRRYRRFRRFMRRLRRLRRLREMGLPGPHEPFIVPLPLPPFG